MKILRIITRLNIGGPARNAVFLTEGIPRTILVCGEVSEDEGDMMYLAREKGIEPVIVPELGRELSIVNDWKAFWKIYRIISRERPNVVHTHTAKAGTLGRGAVILYRLLRRFAPRNDMVDSRFRGNDRTVILVHTFHGHVLHSYFGKIKTFIFICIEKILAIFTDRIIAVSESLKKELAGRFRIAPEEKFSVVELGFELEKLLALEPRLKSDRVNIGIVGRLTAVKNHKMLFKVASRLKAQGLRPGIIVIGDGELRGELEVYARELGIGDTVKFRGWVKDVTEIYRELDIVALTSLNEGTPVSIIEAMAAARPVVVARVGGVSDIVQNRKTGYLVDAGNEEGFTEKLTDLIKNKERRVEFGRYGRESVKDRFAKDRLIEDMKKVYGFPLLRE